MTLDDLAPAMLGIAALIVAVVAASTVWLFLVSPGTVVTTATGSWSPLTHEIVEAFVRTLSALLRYV